MRRLVSTALAVTLLLPALCGAQPQLTAFTYQGRLERQGTVVTGPIDVRASLFATSSGGTALAGPVSNFGVIADEGRFTVPLDFGGTLALADHWIEFSVRSPAGGGEFTVLSPRQRVTASPYSASTRGVHVDATGRVGIGTTSPAARLDVAANSGITHRSMMGPTGYPFQLSGNVALWGDTGLQGAIGVFGTSNQNHSIGILGFASGSAQAAVRGIGWGEYPLGPYAGLFEGKSRFQGSVLIDSQVSTQIPLTLQPALGGLLALNAVSPLGTHPGAYAAFDALPSGGTQYFIGSTGTGSAHGAGKLLITSSFDSPSLTMDQQGRIGLGTTTPESLLTLRRAGHVEVRLHSTTNASGAWTLRAYAAGGTNPSNSLCMVDPEDRPRLMVRPVGGMTFVDGSGSATPPLNTNALGARFVGGYSFYTSAGNTGVVLGSGSTSWSSLCDRDAKENIREVNYARLLDTLDVLPISTFSYKDGNASHRTMGPMAQDFYAAFGLGESDRYVSTLDLSAVAVAGVKGLREEIRRLDAENRELRSRLDRLERCSAR